MWTTANEIRFHISKCQNNHSFTEPCGDNMCLENFAYKCHSTLFNMQIYTFYIGILLLIEEAPISFVS